MIIGTICSHSVTWPSVDRSLDLRLQQRPGRLGPSIQNSCIAFQTRGLRRPGRPPISRSSSSALSISGPSIG